MNIIFETQLQEGSQAMGKAVIRQIQSFADMLDRKHLRVDVELQWTVPIAVALPPVPRGTTPPQYQYVDSATMLDTKMIIGWGHHTSGWELAELTPESRRIVGNSSVSFRGEIPEKALDWVEGQRNGQDALFNIALNTVCLRTRQVIKPPQQPYVQGELVTQRDVAQTAQAYWQDITIPASTWTGEFLKNMRYNGPRYIELPPRPSVAFSPNMRQHLEDALRYLTLGGANLRSVPGACLNALDALAKSLKYEGFRALPEISNEMAPSLPERAKLLTALKNYLNRWRHDNTATGGTIEQLPPITPEEASFVYLGTVHLINFMSQYLPEKVVS